MNTLTFDELKKVIPILAENNVDKDAAFDYFRIVSINNIKYEESHNTLYFLSYATEEELSDGWYPRPFDLRTHVNEIMQKYPNATFVIEEDMINKIDNLQNKFIVVKSISETINQLFYYFRNKSRAKTITVTGSVGKTTTVGLIESVLKTKYKVLRIYSKRITPIILKANIINFLTSDIEYVVIENSIYYHDHVKILSSLMPPYIACMLNIDSSHIGIDRLKTLDDICIYKSEILRNAQYGIINADDDYLRNITMYSNLVEYKEAPLFISSLKNLIRIHPQEIKIMDNKLVLDKELAIKPFILSQLSVTQYLMTYTVASLLGLTIEEIKDAMLNYKPVEHRLNEQILKGKKIILDGDITTYERMKALSDLKDDNTYLVIRKAGSGEDICRVNLIVDFFNRFKKVFIFNDIDYFEEFSQHPNVVVVDSNDFISELDGTIIYHYSGYYRVWDEYNEENLDIYDREKYPIIKDKSLTRNMEGSSIKS